MTMPNNAKALVAAVLTALGPTVAAAVPGSTGVGSTSTIESVIGAIVSYLGVYWTTNGKSPKEAAQGLVVTVKTDVDKFLSAFAAGLPALVQSAAEAAIQPEKAADPAPVVEAGAPVAALDILGKA